MHKRVEFQRSTLVVPTQYCGRKIMCTYRAYYVGTSLDLHVRVGVRISDRVNVVTCKCIHTTINDTMFVRTGLGHRRWRHSPWPANHCNQSNKKHLKNVGPIRYCEPPLHCQSPGVPSRTPAIAIAQAACGYDCSISDPRQTYLIINLRRRTFQNAFPYPQIRFASFAKLHLKLDDAQFG